MDNLIQNLLDSLPKRSAVNALDVLSIREWLIEFNASHADEMKHYPEDLIEPDYDLLMNDADLSKDAMFIVVVLCGKDATFVVGWGTSSDVRQFAENELPEDPLTKIYSIATRFSEVSMPMKVLRTELDAWLGA